ncbi:hypothetical protein ABZ672_03980 [Streptomyces mirabilis]|uniref:hypothetical protein n=1 Tax=Streptomyces mirabilis TaxID=68239 RepID=UPI00340A98EC
MDVRKRITALAATTTLAGLAITGLTAPAQAMAQYPAIAAAGGTAPACIHRAVHSTIGYVRLSNHCGKTMSVKVLISGVGGGAGPCYTLRNGKAVLDFWTPGIQHYRKTVVC